MLKFVLFVILFTTNSFGVTIKIAATVNEEAITSYELEERMKLVQIITPPSNKEGFKDAVLDRIIQEKLILKMAKENNFSISDKELESEIKAFTKGKLNLEKAIKNPEIYSSLKEQLRAEITFSAILQSQLRGKLDFSNDEITRFKNTYNDQNPKQINNEEAKQILSSMKVNETQSTLLKNLQENSIIEKK